RRPCGFETTAQPRPPSLSPIKSHPRPPSQGHLAPPPRARVNREVRAPPPSKPACFCRRDPPNQIFANHNLRPPRGCAFRVRFSSARHSMTSAAPVRASRPSCRGKSKRAFRYVFHVPILSEFVCCTLIASQRVLDTNVAFRPGEPARRSTRGL